MTYTVTITEPGAEPVTVSLEWTTEAPNVVGIYIAERDYIDIETKEFAGSTFSTFDIESMEGSGFGVFENGRFISVGSIFFQRWLGPLPLPPSGA